jgi:ABC-type spermidine/putrescine transport system permease subunit I
MKQRIKVVMRFFLFIFVYNVMFLLFLVIGYTALLHRNLSEPQVYQQMLWRGIPVASTCCVITLLIGRGSRLWSWLLDKHEQR